MRSIRLSLIFCTLVLLFLSLATVSVLAYQQAEASLVAKKESMQRLLKAKYEELRRIDKAATDERCRAEEKKLDDGLLADAKMIASSVHVKLEWPDQQATQKLFSLAAISTPFLPESPLFMPFNLAQGHLQKDQFGKYEPFLLKSWMWTMHVKQKNITQTQKVQDIRLPLDEETNTDKFYQINTVTGDEWRSHSLEKMSLPFDPHDFSSVESDHQAPLVDWKFDRLTLKSGAEVRLVRTKFTRFAVSFAWWGNNPKFKPPTPPPGKEKTPPAPTAPAPNLSIYVQAASDLAPLKKKLGQYEDELKVKIAEYEDELQVKLAELDDSAENTLAELRNRFVLIGGVTLLAAVCGGFLVVRWGLSPVQRLSDAVSQVSEKDFRLPLDATRLPSELRPIAGRLTQTLNLLQRAFDREKQAAADISHELRTPLAAMLATIDVALRKPRTAQDYHEVLEECRASGMQMSELVERMLTLARLDAGADHLRRQEVDVAKLADQCSALVRPLAEARGLSLTVDHNGPACISADPDKVREVLTNLLHNAIEYNKPNGRIDVAVHRDNGTLQLQVRDTGIGIAPEAQEHIFERFYRADPSRHSDGVHAGIGLALVKGYVDLMGGRIALESAPGAGTTFTIELPACEPAE